MGWLCGAPYSRLCFAFTRRCPAGTMATVLPLCLPETFVHASVFVSMECMCASFLHSTRFLLNRLSLYNWYTRLNFFLWNLIAKSKPSRGICSHWLQFCRKLLRELMTWRKQRTEGFHAVEEDHSGYFLTQTCRRVAVWPWTALSNFASSCIHWAWLSLPSSLHRMLWRLKSCRYCEESEVPHTWELYIRQLKLGCLWGKIRRVGKSNLKVYWTILKIIKSRTSDHPAYHSVSWKLELSKRRFPLPCPLLSIRLKGGCYRGGLNEAFNGLFPWSVLTWLFNPARFYTDWWGCFTSYITLREGCLQIDPPWLWTHLC